MRGVHAILRALIVLDRLVAAYQAAVALDPDRQLVSAVPVPLHVRLELRARAIHFGEAEPPAHADDLIPHRTALRRMLDGSYWTGLP